VTEPCLVEWRNELQRLSFDLVQSRPLDAAPAHVVPGPGDTITVCHQVRDADHVRHLGIVGEGGRVNDSERADAQVRADLLANLPQRGIEQRFSLLHCAVHRFPPAAAQWAFEEQELLLLVDDGHYDGSGVCLEQAPAGGRDHVEAGSAGIAASLVAGCRVCRVDPANAGCWPPRSGDIPKHWPTRCCHTPDRMHVEFALLFADRAVAERAATALRAEGYGVHFQDQPDDQSVVVTASPPAMLSADEIAMTTARMAALARELGGGFLGHMGSSMRVLPADPLG